MATRSAPSLLFVVVLLTTAIAMLLLAADIGLWPFGPRPPAATRAGHSPGAVLLHPIACCEPSRTQVANRSRAPATAGSVRAGAGPRTGG